MVLDKDKLVDAIERRIEGHKPYRGNDPIRHELESLLSELKEGKYERMLICQNACEHGVHKDSRCYKCERR